MKYGVRKPSVKKSISARTTGKVNRSLKKAVNPTYGKKGMGVIKDPKKAAYNKVYNKTTVGVNDLFDSTGSSNSGAVENEYSSGVDKVAKGCFGTILLIVGIPFLYIVWWIFSL